MHPTIMPSRCSVLILLSIVSYVLLACDLALSGSVQGHLSIIDLESKLFGNTRKLRIWLPDEYFHEGNQSRDFPVLYLNDGQDLFNADIAILGSEEWQVDEAASQLIADGSIEPIIVVGIDNAGRSGRPREYLPYPDKYLTPPEPSPSGKLYAEFLETEVIPFIESRYRIRAQKESRALGGSSYGALVALHVATSKPNLFGQLLLESPSFYVDDDHVLRDAAETNLSVNRVYLGVGTNELSMDDCAAHPGNELAVDGVRDLNRILIDAGIGSDRILVNVEICAVHSASAWSRRLPVALRFLYGQQGGENSSQRR